MIIYFLILLQALGFHGSQAGFNAGPPQTSPQLNNAMHSLAKWHIPQSAQQSSSKFSIRINQFNLYMYSNNPPSFSVPTAGTTFALRQWTTDIGKF